MKYSIVFGPRYRKDIKKYANFAEDVSKVVKFLSDGISLPSKYKDHKLRGDLSEYRECHVRPDLLLIYKREKKRLILYLFRLGSHSDLF